MKQGYLFIYLFFGLKQAGTGEAEKSEKIPIKDFGGGVVTSLVPFSCSVSSLQQLSESQTVLIRPQLPPYR